MKHIAENTLEEFVLQPARLNEEAVRSINEHVSQCKACAEILEFLRSVHADLKSLEYMGYYRVDGFVKSLFRTTNVIPLVPFKPRLDPSAFDERYTTVLAAMTEPDDRRRFRTLGTFASQTENAVLRITHDREAQKLRLYVQSEDPRASAYSIISAPELSSDFVTDEHGRLTIGASESLLRADWSSLKPVLHLRVVEYRMKSTVLETATSDRPVVMEGDSKAALRAWTNKGELIIQMDERGKDFSRAVVEYSDDKKVLVNMEAGTGNCAFDSSARDVLIRLYQ